MRLDNKAVQLQRKLSAKAFRRVMLQTESPKLNPKGKRPREPRRSWLDTCRPQAVMYIRKPGMRQTFWPVLPLK